MAFVANVWNEAGGITARDVDFNAKSYTNCAGNLTKGNIGQNQIVNGNFLAVIVDSNEANSPVICSIVGRVLGTCFRPHKSLPNFVPQDNPYGAVVTSDGLTAYFYNDNSTGLWGVTFYKCAISGATFTSCSAVAMGAGVSYLDIETFLNGATEMHLENDEIFYVGSNQGPKGVYICNIAEGVQNTPCQFYVEPTWFETYSVKIAINVPVV